MKKVSKIPKNPDPEIQYKIEVSNLQFVVLLNLIIERIEFLETQEYCYGSIKNFLKNSKVKYENFMKLVFNSQEKIEKDSALAATNKLLVMQERVENALENKYVITVDERRARAREVLSKFIINPMLDKAIQELEERNMFNF